MSDKKRKVNIPLITCARPWRPERVPRCPRPATFYKHNTSSERTVLQSRSAICHPRPRQPSVRAAVASTFAPPRFNVSTFQPPSLLPTICTACLVCSALTDHALLPPSPPSPAPAPAPPAHPPPLLRTRSRVPARRRGVGISARRPRFAMPGTCAAQLPTLPPKATGGIITTSGGYTIHTLTSSGAFEVTDATLTSVEALVVAGGGGSGTGVGSGGGAGGRVNNTLVTSFRLILV